MIDMDYEKKYNEALERARYVLHTVETAGCAMHKDLLTEIFPELAESEDERIRKEIIKFIQDFCNPCDPDCDKWIAYLEKQKYDRMKPVYDARESFESALAKAWNDYHNGYEKVDKLEDDYVECAHAKGFREGYLFGLEKQKEQKPAEWSEEDKTIIDCAVEVVEKAGLPSLAASLKSLRPQPKEEDCAYITPNKEFFQWIYDRLVYVHKENPNVDYMRSFKERIDNSVFDQCHWKPSEDEERLINTSISFLKDFADKGYENAVECIDWLKSKLNGNACK